MPSAAKVWKRHVRGSTLHTFFLSRFAPAEKSQPIGPSLPSDIRRAKEEGEAQAKRKRRELVSLPSTMASDRSTEHMSDVEDPLNLASQEQGIRVPEKAVLVLNDPSGFLKKSNNP
jgi:hypothetical protein